MGYVVGEKLCIPKMKDVDSPIYLNGYHEPLITYSLGSRNNLSYFVWRN